MVTIVPVKLIGCSPLFRTLPIEETHRPQDRTASKFCQARPGDSSSRIGSLRTLSDQVLALVTGLTLAKIPIATMRRLYTVN